MSYFDEAGIFLGSLGRYSSGGSMYDRGVFLNLWNGPNMFNRDCKGVKTRLKNPLFNMIMNAHPQTFTRYLEDEMLFECDGFFMRMLFWAPAPLFDVKSEEMRETPDPDISAVCLLYAIEVFNEKGLIFEFDKEAYKVYDAYVDIFRRMIKLANNIDGAIG